MSVSPLRAQFIDQLRVKGYSECTVENYVSAVAAVSRRFGKSPLLLTTDEVRQYLLHLLEERKFAPATVNLHLDSIKTFFRLMAPASTVMGGFSHVKNGRRIPLVLSLAECRRMIEVTTNLKHKAIIMVLCTAGLRLMECINLKPRHIESERMKIRVEQGKGKVDRYTILSEKTLVVLREYFRVYRPKEYLFEGDKEREPFGTRTVGYIVSKAARLAKIDKKVHPHTLRHSFATHLMEAGVPLPVIQRLLGHGSIKTSMIYVHVAQPLVDRTVCPLDMDRGVAHG